MQKPPDRSLERVGRLSFLRHLVLHCVVPTKVEAHWARWAVQRARKVVMYWPFLGHPVLFVVRQGAWARPILFFQDQYARGAQTRNL